MITDTSLPHSFLSISNQIKKRIAVNSQTLLNVMQQFQETCLQRNYFIAHQDLKGFVQLMKFNIENMILQVSECMKEMRGYGKDVSLIVNGREDMQKIKGELVKQQKLNQLMKEEVLELNQLISDHLRANDGKSKEKDEVIGKLKQQVVELNRKVEMLTDEKRGSAVQNYKSKQIKTEASSNEISIVDEDDDTDPQLSSKTSYKQQQHLKTNLEVIIQQQQLFSTSRIQPRQPSSKLQSDQQPHIIIKYKTQPNQTDGNDLQYIDLMSVNLRDHKRSQSKNKAKFFLNDFRKIIETDNVPMCLPSKGSSKFASGESSQSRLSVARNESENINVPYRTSTPKKLFSKKKNDENNSFRKVKPRCQISSIFEQKGEKLRLSERSNSINIPKQRPSSITNSRTSSKQKIKQKDMNIHMSRPSSKQKLSLTIKPEQTKQRSSQDLSYRMPLKKMFEQEIIQLDLNVGEHPVQIHYQTRSGSNATGVAFYGTHLRYEGSFNEGLRHGFGVIYHGSAQVYKGEWERNKLCGKGRLQNVHLVNKKYLSESSVLSQFIYIGEFEENRLHGSGELVFFSGDRIKTSFHDNRPEGTLEYLNKYNQISNSRWYDN